MNDQVIQHSARLISDVGCIYAPLANFVTNVVCRKRYERCINAPYKTKARGWQ
jgi:hypothetical protein